MIDLVCECPFAGYCQRDSIVKSKREHQWCQGGPNLSPGKRAAFLKKWTSNNSDIKSPCVGCGRTSKRTLVAARCKPGTELKRLFSFFGQYEKEGCNCVKHADLMDQRGCDWCEANIDTIAKWVTEEAEKRSFAGITLDKVPGFDFGLKAAIYHAISAARSKSAVEEVKQERSLKAQHLEAFKKKYQLSGTPLVEPTRHLMWHFTPWVGDSRWIFDKYIALLKEQAPYFNGRRVVAIITPEVGSRKQWASPEEVQDLLGSAFDYIILENVVRLREAQTLPLLLQEVMTNDPNHIAFFGHNKGISHPDPNSVTHLWGDCMIETVLRQADKLAIPQLERKGVTGAFKRYGQFKTAGNHRWHYSGTYWWVRLADAFPRSWKYVDQQFFGAESWPGSHFMSQEADCVFWDSVADLYLESPDKLRAELKKWECKYLHKE